MSKVEQLQEELKKLRKEREAVIFEKGLAAEDNKDLRENGAYIAMEEKEHLLTSKIRKVTLEIQRLTTKKAAIVRKQVKEVKFEFKPNKWL